VPSKMFPAPGAAPPTGNMNSAGHAKPPNCRADSLREAMMLNPTIAIPPQTASAIVRPTLLGARLVDEVRTAIGAAAAHRHHLLHGRTDRVDGRGPSEQSDDARGLPGDARAASHRTIPRRVPMWYGTFECARSAGGRAEIRGRKGREGQHVGQPFGKPQVVEVALWVA
jgi:hypothetical protein